MTGLVALTLLGFAGIAFMYGLAKADEIGWPADTAMVTAAVSMVLSLFFWDYDWTAITGAVGGLAVFALIAMANGWWKP